MSLQSEIDDLRRITHQLLFLGLDNEPIYSDSFRQLNADVYRSANRLYSKRSADIKEESSLCLALLTGYNATLYNDGDKEEKVQSVLNRIWKILPLLPASLLKCQLLVACYGEIYEEELSAEAHAIIDTWAGRELTAEEQEVIENLQSREENPCSWSVVE